MLNIAVLGIAALLLTGCSALGLDDEDDPPQPPAVGVYLNPMDPTNWYIGPIVNGENYSVNMPLHPSPHPDGWVLSLPLAGGSAHYVTMAVGSLTGQNRIVMQYRVEVDPGVSIVSRSDPSAASALTLYFERKGVRWTSTYEDWRWYASFATQRPIMPGQHQMQARFDENWTAALTSTRETNPVGFAAALENAGRVGFVLGGGDGLGHGVYATGPARIVVTEFKVE